MAAGAGEPGGGGGVGRRGVGSIVSQLAIRLTFPWAEVCYANTPETRAPVELIFDDRLEMNGNQVRLPMTVAQAREVIAALLEAIQDAEAAKREEDMHGGELE